MVSIINTMYDESLFKIPHSRKSPTPNFTRWQNIFLLENCVFRYYVHYCVHS